VPSLRIGSRKIFLVVDWTPLHCHLPHIRLQVDFTCFFFSVTNSSAAPWDRSLPHTNMSATGPWAPNTPRRSDYWYSHRQPTVPRHRVCCWWSQWRWHGGVRLRSPRSERPSVTWQRHQPVIEQSTRRRADATTEVNSRQTTVHRLHTTHTQAPISTLTLWRLLNFKGSQLWNRLPKYLINIKSHQLFKRNYGIT